MFNIFGRAASRRTSVAASDPQSDSWAFASHATPQATLGAPYLLDDERALFERVLAGGVQRYLEFGMGGSTIAAIQAGAKEIVAVDSSAAWVESMRASPQIASYVPSDAITLIHADIGPVGEWGRPFDRGAIDRWPAYIAKPWAEWGRRGTLPDVVFVDGRFRVASILSVAIAFAGRERGTAGPKILMHDISDARPGYAPVYDACDEMDGVGTLKLLSLKYELDWPVLLVTFVESLSNPE